MASPQRALVIVESPAKATTISRYLGKGYDVLASYGHVRDLIEKDGAVDPDHGFAMTWQVPPQGKKRLKEIAQALGKADTLYLATDPDREGEAIAWHLHAELERLGKLKQKTVRRIVFHEITKPAVLKALEHPRELDDNLIDAYRARRGLDYLVGYRLSPVLWRKMPNSRSAGRVQSVALRLVCEREDEIDAFESQEYWQIQADFTTPRDEGITARLSILDGKKLDKLSLGTQQDAEHAIALCQGQTYSITEQSSRQEVRRSVPPFNTSTLLQEASRKLHFTTSQTMQLAQKLYEGVGLMGGLITYMRTDGISMSSEAITGIRQVVGKQYGAEYVPEKPRLYKNKSKNAQEAHEAVRPTDPARTPQSLMSKLDPAMLKLYQLIWNRAVASQMNDAQIQRVFLDITSDDARAVFHASGQSILFPGFLALYEVSKSRGQEKEDSSTLPVTQQGEVLALQECRSSQHCTQPPPRYSEASLVKQMEEVGIGRPSTYSSVLKVLQD
ncbi:MAG: type I DNA topoisomerase, partial [Alphaproteobacteria bacterium]|nr:type I DNA topoisomerase [Alphaproteobacteria bacterium]